MTTKSPINARIDGRLADDNSAAWHFDTFSQGWHEDRT